jgi:hypothetical protein
MACTISKGRLDYSCKTIIGGLKNIYIGDFQQSIADLSVSIGAIDLSAINPSVYKYELVNDGNTFEESNEANEMAGTSTFTQTGTFVLKGQDAISQVELQNLAKNKVQIYVEDHMGNLRAAGREFGCVVTVGTTSGGAIGDMNGYNVSFTARATELAPFCLMEDLEIESAVGDIIDPN